MIRCAILCYKKRRLYMKMKNFRDEDLQKCLNSLPSRARFRNCVICNKHFSSPKYLTWKINISRNEIRDEAFFFWKTKKKEIFKLFNIYVKCIFLKAWQILFRKRSKYFMLRNTKQPLPPNEKLHVYLISTTNYSEKI